MFSEMSNKIFVVQCESIYPFYKMSSVMCTFLQLYTCIDDIDDD